MGDNTPVPSGPAEARDDLIEQYIETQRSEIALKAQSLEFEKQKDANSFEFSKAALAAQERDRKSDRDFRRQQKKDGHRFMLWMAAILAILICAALYMDKEQVAMEVVKAIIYISAGASVGYGLAAKKAAADKSNEGDQPQDG